MTAAARQWDPIEHSNAMGGLLAGLAIGATAALIGLAIVGTGGLAAVAIVGASAVAGAGIGELVGSLSFAVQSAGNIVSGSSNVHVNGLPAARAHVDKAKCDKHGSSPQTLAQGSGSVHINGMPAARVGDATVCDGKISAGSGNVFIGGGTDTTDDISPEVPEWLHRTMFVVGVSAAVVLAGPAVAIAATVAGYVGGSIGFRTGGRLFGDGSDGQKLSAFGGALLGGGLGAKGGRWFDAKYEIEAKGLGSNLGNIGVRSRNTGQSFKGILRGEKIELPGVRMERFEYVKRDPLETKALRRQFDSAERAAYLRSLADRPDKVSALKEYGFNEVELARIQEGKLPNRFYQVHHIKPLDDGGSNSFSNLVLIKNDPYHQVITNHQRITTGKMIFGERTIVDWPMIKGDIYPPTSTGNY